MTFKMNKYGNSITDEMIASTIYSDISKNTGEIVIDFEGILTMTTICSRIIFGQLLTHYGAEQFFKNVTISNASKNMQSIISIGLEGSSTEEEK